ncbi:MAG: LytTR family DNA-binding domain-containing protein [Lachnospiraceae bacterium]|nr:LytTR family DNA-binding domain-containing protein [Lachnospiraceae bacterium]
MISIAVCDDDVSALNKIKACVSKWMYLHKVLFEIRGYESSGEFLFDIEDGKNFDLILCDIEMPKVSGMEIAKLIREKLPYCITIFITSYIRYAVDAFELNIFRFIPKNQIELRLSGALKDAWEMIRIQQKEYYVIENISYIEKIAYQDIIYIQKDKNYTVFYLKHHKKARVRKSLKHVVDELGHDDYELIQRDIAVNLFHVTKLESGKIFLIDNICLPISANRQELIKNRISGFWEAHL